jgi:DNA-binding MarR family transcriptional regulator
MEAIEAVLERHKLALVTQHADGESRLIGIIGLEERRAWEIIQQLGAGAAVDIADAIGLTSDAADQMLDILWRRRLLIRYDNGYVAVGSAVVPSHPSSLNA